MELLPPRDPLLSLSASLVQLLKCVMSGRSVQQRPKSRTGRFVVLGALVACVAAAGVGFSRLGTREAPAWSKNLHAKVIDYMAHTHKQIDVNRRRNLFDPIPNGAKVLEVGAGTGVNFQYMAHKNKTIYWTGIEPNPFMHDYLRNESKKFGSIHVDEIISLYAEDAKLPANAFDAAVTTHVLCSVEDVSKVVEAIHATLKPGASYYFLEHVEAPSERPWLQKVQHLIQPLWGKAADHCHVIRRPQDEIRCVFGAENVKVEPFVADVPTVLMPIEPHIVGRATKAK